MQFGYRLNCEGSMLLIIVGFVYALVGCVRVYKDERRSILGGFLTMALGVLVAGIFGV